LAIKSPVCIEAEKSSLTTMAMRSALLLALASFWPCLAVSPTEKVIEMLTKLKAEVTEEGVAEETNFAEFKTFCETTTEEKEEAIKSGVDTSDAANATINEKTALYNSAIAAVEEAKAKDTAFDKEKTDSERQCASDKKAYEAKAADLSAAIVGLESAIDKMEAAKGTGALLQFPAMEHSLQLASAMGLLQESKRQEVTAFLQGHKDKAWSEEEGPEHNKKDYEYQSGGIVSTLQDLLAEFTKEHTDAESEWTTTKTACEEQATLLADKISTNAEAQANQEETASNLKADAASSKETLLLTQKALKADRSYLEELKEDCVARAADHSQRKVTREGEIEAIGAALNVLEKELPGSEPAAEETAAPSFLQLEETSASVNHVVQASHVSAQVRLAKNLQMKAADRVEAAGSTLSSSRLAGLAVRMRKTSPANVAANPLTAVKDMVNDLIGKLIKEAEEESTQKGFCDSEMGKAKKERDRRLREAKKLNTKIKVLDTKRTELIESNEVLTSSLSRLNADLSEATELRTNQSKTNLATIADAKAGTAAVKGAIKSLQDFYSKASRGAARHDKEMALLQLKKAPAEGSYGGKQQQSNGIVTMMEVIQGDFEKTASSTAAAEEKANEEFVKLRQDSKAAIAGKSTQLKLNKEDKESSENSLQSMGTELGRVMDLLDAALRTLEDLKPQCVDNVMSYAERKAKRDAEIASLTTAMCTLVPEGVVEEKCQ